MKDGWRAPPLPLSQTHTTILEHQMLRAQICCIAGTSDPVACGVSPVQRVLGSDEGREAGGKNMQIYVSGRQLRAHEVCLLEECVVRQFLLLLLTAWAHMRSGYLTDATEEVTYIVTTRNDENTHGRPL